MSNLGKITISDEQLSTGRVKIFVDDKEVHGVVGYKIEHNAGEVPVATLYKVGDIDYSVLGKVQEEVAITDDSLEMVEDVLKRAARENKIDVRYVAQLLNRVLPLLPKEEYTGSAAD